MQLFRKKSIADATNQGLLESHGPGLKRHLTVRDLTAFGIAAIIGAGIFSTIGKASADGGPAVVLLFIFTAIACGFAAFCYAEFAGMVPVSGSAYTYSYVAFGELSAWIIGWALIMEYAIGNIVVAISWSGYFSTLLTHLQLPALGFPNGIHLPAWSGIDYFSAKRAFETVQSGLADNAIMESEAYKAWITAPMIGGIRFIMDIPAMLINIVITWLVYMGIKESKNASNMMVALKLIVVLVVITLGMSYVQPDNWTPFMPEGIGGVLAGVSAVFFAYIGFDAISTTAEECHNPQRDLPRGMLYSIIICTVLYILISLVLTGMVPYKSLDVDDPLAFAFGTLGLDWISGMIAVSAVIAMAGVLLVFQLGQPRIWMSMSRDGLLPKKFATIHPKFGTPSFATIVTGLLVGVPLLLIDMDTVVDLCSIGTLFAFVMVCGGVLVLDKDKTIKRSFKVPYIDSRFITPALFIVFCWFMVYIDPTWFGSHANPLANVDYIPMFIFVIVFLVMSVLSYQNRLSLIPVLGILSCLYLMAQIHVKNWAGFTIWLIAGLVIYFSYGYHKSKLKKS